MTFYLVVVSEKVKYPFWEPGMEKKITVGKRKWVMMHDSKLEQNVELELQTSWCFSASPSSASRFQSSECTHDAMKNQRCNLPLGRKIQPCSLVSQLFLLNFTAAFAGRVLSVAVSIHKAGIPYMWGKNQLFCFCGHTISSEVSQLYLDSCKEW